MTLLGAYANKPISDKEIEARARRCTAGINFETTVERYEVEGRVSDALREASGDKEEFVKIIGLLTDENQRMHKRIAELQAAPLESETLKRVFSLTEEGVISLANEQCYFLYEGRDDGKKAVAGFMVAYAYFKELLDSKAASDGGEKP